MTDQELKDLVASLAIAQAKTDAQMAKTDAQMAKTDAQMAKTDAQMAKTDAQIARTEVQMAKTDEKLNRLSDWYGGVSSSLGASAEEFFYNTLTANPVLGNIHFDRIMSNIQISTKTKQGEFDIVLINGNSVAVVEVKYKVHPSDIEKTAKNLIRYRELFPEYKNYTLYGGIAGFSVPPDAVKAAKDKGMFVLKRVGEILKTDAKEMRAFV